MNGNFQDIVAIKELLKKYPKGLSITEISSALHLHRNTSAKYLDMLKLKGDIDRKEIGAAKNYSLVRRMPVSTLLHFCLHPAIVLDSRSEVVMVNAEALSLLACPLDVIYGAGVKDIPLSLFKDPEVGTRCHDAAQGVRSQAPVQTVVGGKRLHLTVHYLPVVFDTGRDGCALVLVDETACRQAAEERDLCRKRYGALIADQTEFVAHIRPDMTLASVNEALCVHLGRARDQLAGFRFLSLFSPEDREQIRRGLSSLLPTAPAFTADVRTVRQDGSVCWERWTFRGIFGEDGSFLECHALGQDITEMKNDKDRLKRYHENLETLIRERTQEMQQANMALVTVIREKEELEQELLFTQFAFDNASDSIILFDEEGWVYKANRTAGELLGYTAEEFQGISVIEINPSITQAQWDRMQAGASPGVKERTRSTHKRKDGRIIEVEVSRTFVTFGERMYFCSIAREVLPRR
jgi:PAS domain S-box-containing protein